MQTVGTPMLWIGFVVFVIAMLAIDLGVFHRRAHRVSLKEAGTWSAVWVAVSLGFNVLVFVWFGADRALEFTTGYLLEYLKPGDVVLVLSAGDADQISTDVLKGLQEK